MNVEPQTKTEHVAEYDYPGLLFPDTRRREIPEPILQSAIFNKPDDGRYAVTVSSRTLKRFTADDGEVTWVPTGKWERVGRWVVGEKIHVDDVPDSVDPHGILHSNIRGNSTDGYAVKCRTGNWQIAQEYTAVLNPKTMQVSA